MLVPLKKVLSKADKGGYAVPAFNINNMEILQAVMEAAIKLKSPVIIQTSEGAIEYAGMDYIVAMVGLAAKAKVPVVLHLDHGKDLKIIKKAIDSGYASVMIDASSKPFAENVAATKKVVGWAKKKGVSVEAEIGAISGVEDFVSVSEKQAFFTDPEEARKFVEKTGCDALAVSIGTAHGAFKSKGKVELDISRLAKINKMVKVPLVLHGASGVPKKYVDLANKYGADLGETEGVGDNWIKLAIKNGIRKINTDTDLRLAFLAGVREALFNDKKVFDPRKILGPAKEIIKEVAENRIKLFGSAGKA
ncbi:MAG: class II fructose-1,6-bisphosphate aldolase [Patescibacteria group bacterium]